MIDRKDGNIVGQRPFCLRAAVCIGDQRPLIRPTVKLILLFESHRHVEGFSVRHLDIHRAAKAAVRIQGDGIDLGLVLNRKGHIARRHQKGILRFFGTQTIVCIVQPEIIIAFVCLHRKGDLFSFHVVFPHVYRARFLHIKGKRHVVLMSVMSIKIRFFRDVFPHAIALTVPVRHLMIRRIEPTDEGIVLFDRDRQIKGCSVFHCDGT